MNGYDRAACKHKKVYSNYVLTSNPPQYPWICEKCGTEGTDVGPVFHSRYEEIKEKFDKQNKRRIEARMELLKGNGFSEESAKRIMGLEGVNDESKED